MPAHLTLFRHLPPSLVRELGSRLVEATRAPPPHAVIAGVMDLGEGTALRVESEALGTIRADLAAAFHGLLMPQDQAPWQPHITIQNKVTRRAARALQTQLGADFAPRPIAIRALAAWRYADGAWEPAKTWPFRL